MLFCIDIGNTHTHFGVVADDGARFMRHVITIEIEDPARGIAPELERALAEYPAIRGVAFCSVVPAATGKLIRVLSHFKLPSTPFQLSYDKKLGVEIGYPRPQEIGQDRLANAVGAKAFFGVPAIVIDMGTAVTFDVVTQQNGYEGGIIAPGVEVMRKYLHEQTALLPKLEGDLEVSRAIGQSTVEAMRIGTVIGFGGMIQALLNAVVLELSARGETNPRVLATGGTAELLRKTLQTPFQTVPDITLRGLAVAWELNATA